MNQIKRIVRFLLVFTGLFIIILVGSVLVDYAIGRDRLDALANITIPGVEGAPDVAAYVARPEGRGPFPVVIMIHEFFGLNESIISKARGLAEEGYLVVAPDTFRGSTTAWIPRAIFQVITTSPEQVDQDLDTVYAWIQSQPDVDASRTGVVGFCYGGRASLSYSLHNPGLAATVIFYGSPETDPQVLQSLPGPVLGIFGEADGSIPLGEVRDFEAALEQAGIPNQISIYEGQPHAFLTSMDAIRAGGAQGQAWQEMVDFLEIHLKQGGSTGQLGGGTDYRSPFALGYYARLVIEHTFRHAGSH